MPSAVAMAVNQGELWVTLLSCLAVYSYVLARRAGGVIPARTIIGIGALYFVACFFKPGRVLIIHFSVPLHSYATTSPARPPSSPSPRDASRQTPTRRAFFAQ